MAAIPEGLDDGVRDLVVYLIGAGFYTTDSGDGSKVGRVDGALPFKHVFMQVPPVALRDGAKELRDAALRFGLTVGEQGTAPWYIQASYDPCTDSSAVLMLAEDPEYDPEDVNFRRSKPYIGTAEARSEAELFVAWVRGNYGMRPEYDELREWADRLAVSR